MWFDIWLPFKYRYGGVVACPPNGIQPFLGQAKYIAPLCYLFLDNISIYTTMRSMYCQIWSMMNVISSNPGTLYHVCQTFERLVIESNLRLYSHLLKLKIEPLQVKIIVWKFPKLLWYGLFIQVAMPWLQLGFVGFLEIDQILLLWDRLIGQYHLKDFYIFLKCSSVNRFHGYNDISCLCSGNFPVQKWSFIKGNTLHFFAFELLYALNLSYMTFMISLISAQRMLKLWQFLMKDQDWRWCHYYRCFCFPVFNKDFIQLMMHLSTIFLY